MNSTNAKTQSRSTPYWCPCCDDGHADKMHLAHERRHFRADLTRGLYD